MADNLPATPVRCDNCGSYVDGGLLECPRCHASLILDAALALPADRPRDRMLDRPWVLIVLILHLGLLGIPIYWKTKHSVSVRVSMIVVSVAYTIFALAVIYWGIVQILRLF